MKKKLANHIIQLLIIFLVSIVSCTPKPNKNQDEQGQELKNNKDSLIVKDMLINESSNQNTITKPVEVIIERITESQFNKANQSAKVNKPLQKITDFKTVQQQLKDVVEFEEIGDYLGIKNIKFRNGTLVKAEDLDECSFVAYFPEEDILLCEGGHTIDVSFNLSTGQTTYDVGNPNLVTTSPNGQYRLNKIFEGQECFYHFIQEKKNGNYQKIIALDEIFKKKFKKWLCIIEKEFWTDDRTLYFGLVTEFRENGNNYEYYRMKIINR